MTTDVAPSRYWELMADKRKEALELSMKENKLLKLKYGVNVLEQENCLLDDHVKEANVLSELVQGLVSVEDSLPLKEE